jgi:16S rRNA (uracil1498-N3)-methyltransferase
MSDKHIFALYTNHTFPSHEYLGNNRPYTFTDADLWHRINHVLRIKPDEEIVIFDGNIKVHARLMNNAKKNVVSVTVLEAAQTRPLKPHIHLYQGLLRREALSEVVYLAAQMGVTSLTPVITSKTQRSWGGQKEIERLRSVMIAACEQAKQFTIPVINEPIEVSALPEHMTLSNACSLYCEPEGQLLLHALNDVSQKKYAAINICIGPEGGFTDQEQDILKNIGARCYALTPTILRSQEAVAVCVGALRSVLGHAEQ